MLKKLVSILALCIVTGAFAEDWDGSTSKPTSKEIDGVEYYVITSPSELAWFAYQVNNKDQIVNAVLDNDLFFMDDTSATSKQMWTQISKDSTHSFAGVIDGAGHTIYGIYGDYFVGYLNTSGIVKNINFQADSMTSIIYSNKGNVLNINNYGLAIKGIVHDNHGNIMYCNNISKAGNYRAGIAYFNRENGFISHCENDADNNYSSGVDSLGGISVVNFGTIDSSKSRVTITSVRRKKQYSNVVYYVRIGGIAAENVGTIRNSSAKVQINNMNSTYGNFRTYVGGIAGINGASVISIYINGTIENIYDTELRIENIQTGDYLRLGGTVGYNYSGKIDTVQSALHVKALYLDAASENEYLNGLTMGGVAGTSYKAIVKESFGALSIDSVYINNAYDANPYSIGGIVGYSDSSLTNSHSLTSIKSFYVDAFAENGEIPIASLAGYLGGQISSSYGIILLGDDTTRTFYSGRSFYAGQYYSAAGLIWKSGSSSSISNCYFDKTLLNDSVSAILNNNSSSVFNATGKTTAVMQSESFVKTLNTNAGLDDDSGIWQYCEGRYPILVSEGTCDEFYSKYGLSSSSSAESSSSTPVESSSSEAESNPSSSSALTVSSSSVSSSSAVESSSSDAMSSSSEKASGTTSSSSSENGSSSSSKEPDAIWKTVQPSFHLAVEGMTVTLSKAQGGVVRIFDALGHLVASKPLAGPTTSITLQTPGNYIVRVNGTSRMATLK